MGRVQAQIVKSRSLYSYKPKFFYQMNPHSKTSAIIFFYQNIDTYWLLYTMTPNYQILFTARQNLVDWQCLAAVKNPGQTLDGVTV